MRMDLKSFARSSETRQGLEGRPGRSRGERMADNIKKYFVSFMDKDTLSVMQDAQHDLIFGPGEEGARGFDTATKQLSKWWGEHGYDVWYDYDSEQVYDSEPGEEYLVEAGGDIVFVDRADARQHVFGRELSKFIRHG